MFISDMYYSTYLTIMRGRSNNWASNKGFVLFLWYFDFNNLYFVIFCQCTYLPRGLLQGWFGTIFFYTFGALWEVWYALEIVEDYNTFGNTFCHHWWVVWLCSYVTIKSERKNFLEEKVICLGSEYIFCNFECLFDKMIVWKALFVNFYI